MVKTTLKSCNNGENDPLGKLISYFMLTDPRLFLLHDSVLCHSNLFLRNALKSL